MVVGYKTCNHLLIWETDYAMTTISITSLFIKLLSEGDATLTVDACTNFEAAISLPHTQFWLCQVSLALAELVSWCLSSLLVIEAPICLLTLTSNGMEALNEQQLYYWASPILVPAHLSLSFMEGIFAVNILLNWEHCHFWWPIGHHTPISLMHLLC